jgi:hypothetical protein
MQENDRRFRQRFDMKVQVKILNLDSPDLIEQQVDSSNISARGVYSSTDLPLNIGARVEMSLTMPVEIAERIHGFGAARRLPPTSKAPSKRNFAFPATSWSHTEKACTLTIRLTYPPLIFRTTAFLPTKPATPVTATTASMAAFAPSSGALRHIYIQYFGTPPRPEDISSTSPTTIANACTVTRALARLRAMRCTPKFGISSPAMKCPASRLAATIRSTT